MPCPHKHWPGPDHEQLLDAGAAGAEALVNTWLFVDLDGVVNIGIRDDEGGMLDFNPTNLRRALKREEFLCCRSRDASARRILSVSNFELGHGEHATCMKFLASPQLHASDVLIDRLAQLISAAGSSRRVILTSRKRLRHHAERVFQIEDAISHSLGRPFSFDDRTPPCQDVHADQRLSLIGAYIAKHCNPSQQGTRVRVLVLDDFFATPLSGWRCDGVSMSSAEDVERYLSECFADTSSASVRLLHTYDEWKTQDGLHVQIGSGLTMAHLCNGLHFLGQHQCDYCVSKLRNAVVSREEITETLTTAGFDTIFCWLPVVQFSKLMPLKNKRIEKCTHV